MADDVGSVKSKISIVDLVESSGIKLKKSGKNFLGLCPFHPDKNPSMHVNPDFGTYRCYSCGAKGDVFQWVMQSQNVDFREALQILADRAGVTLSGKGKGAPEDKSLRKRRQEAMDFTSAFFAKQLESSKEAKNYCQSRGITAQIIEKWNIGFAPDGGEDLVLGLKRNGFSLREAAELYLVEGNDSQGYQDRFRGRLMFPIRDERGQTVGFGGRIIGQGSPKYINSSETPIFHKGRTLYGLFESQAELKQTGTALLVEGYLDVIACHEASAGAAMASLGTSLTEEQAKLIKRWADRAVIAYDADEAGQKATEKAADTFASVGVPVSIARLKADDDPFSILQQHGAPALQAVLQEVENPLTFAINRIFDQRGAADQAAWNEVVQRIALSGDDMAVSAEIDRIAGRYPGIVDVAAGRRALRGLVSRARKSGRERVKPAAVEDSLPMKADVTPTAPVRIPRAEEAVLAAYLEGSLRQPIHDRMKDRSLFTSGHVQSFCDAVFKAFPDNCPDGPPSHWLHLLDGEFDWLEALPSERYGAPSADFLNDCFDKLERERKARDISQGEGASDTLEKAMERLRILKSVESGKEKDFL